MENERRGSGKRSVEESKKSRELTQEERDRFNKLIVPKMKMIRQLVGFYINDCNVQDFEAFYNTCLYELAIYSYTFDTSEMEKLNSWIHVCVKRCVCRQNLKAYKERTKWTGVSMDSFVDSTTHSPSILTEPVPFVDAIPDYLYNALLELPTKLLKPMLLSVQGYHIDDIMEIGIADGWIGDECRQTVNRRILEAKSVLRNILIKNGYKRYTHKS